MLSDYTLTLDKSTSEHTILSRGVPVELFVTGTDTGILGKNFAGAGTGIFHAVFAGLCNQFQT